MLLYHGGTEVVKQPLILPNQRLLDFGKGFYTTSSRIQAEKWAYIKQKRSGKTLNAVVSKYEFDKDAFKNYNYLFFEAASEKWLDFILLNRKEDIVHGYDIVRGAVANDTLYETLLLFETGVLSRPETIARLKTHTLFDQISFHSQEVLNKLIFIESYNL